ncbi:hypothetical protein WICMUC_004744 [Wickerhamomyces mucosus]|uniref:Serine aminopeptidase S33 domain-containing protein n=1 Tax=Wickerhamomyces mucosus TaxID=1378264 RepID=A0A9P8PG44_9ASCO|nr:hypothetical protein WICMUC_004744 [Wickerhamomyces mucosus]
MILIAAASVATISMGLLYKFQRLLIYPSSMNNSREKTDKPSMYGIPFEENYLETKDGIKLHSYLMLQNPNSSNYTNKTIVILCPNAGNIGHSLPIVELFFKNFGYNVFIYSYRGYGFSTGEPSEMGLKIDADTAMNFLAQHDQISKSSIFLYGRSLGGAVAIYIASKNYFNVHGVILENTFINLRACIPHIFPLLSNVAFLCHDKWDSEKDILQINQEVSVLFLSATDDEIVPPQHMDRLYKVCNSTNKNIVRFKDSKHNETVTFPNYWDIIYEFITKSV